MLQKQMFRTIKAYPIYHRKVLNQAQGTLGRKFQTQRCQLNWKHQPIFNADLNLKAEQILPYFEGSDSSEKPNFGVGG